jgi:hypothetical protein
MRYLTLLCLLLCLWSPAQTETSTPVWSGDWDVELAQCNGLDVDGTPFPNYLRLDETTLSLRDTICEILQVTPGGRQGTYLFQLNCPEDEARSALVSMQTQTQETLSLAFGILPERPLVRCPERPSSEQENADK